MGDRMDYQQRRTVQAEATRRAILEAAAALARQEGFSRITIRDICARAGVTTGAFYHHFTSKDDLLNQGFASLDSYMETALVPYQDAPPLERLNALLRLYAQYMEELGWETVSLYYERRLSDPTSGSMSPDRYTLRAMLECLSDLSASGELTPTLTPEWTAEFFFRHFRGTVIDWVLHRGGYPLWPRLTQDYQVFFKVFHT